MDIYIKNMVCNRCIMVVSGIFRDSGFPDATVQMGKVSVDHTIAADDLALIGARLNEAGFKIINDSKSRLIEQIKKLTIDHVYHSAGEQKENFSDYLTDKLHLDYNYLTTLFSSVESTSINTRKINQIQKIRKQKNITAPCVARAILPTISQEIARYVACT